MSELTFKEDDVAHIVEFLNVVATSARFNNLTIKEMGRIHTLYQKMIDHAAVCEAHIMELKEIIEPPKKES